MEAAEQIRELTKLLEEANYQYYVLDDPKMEDYEYDRLMRQLGGAGDPASGAGIPVVTHKTGGGPGYQPV